MTATRPHRPLVPTDRQLDLGHPEPAAISPSYGEKSRQVEEAEEAEKSEEPDGRAWVRTLRDADPRRIAGPRTPLLVFGLVALIGQWDDAALGALLPEIRAELGLSTQVLATISSAVSLVALTLALPAGHLADRVKRTVLLRFSIVATNVASVVQALAPGLGQLVTGRLVAGSGIAVQNASSFSFLADTFPRSSRTRVFGFTTLIGLVGAILGPLVAGVLGEAFGWRVALGGLGALATGVGLLTLLLREPVRGRLDRIDAGAPADVADDSVPPPLPMGEALRAAWSVRTVRRLVFATPFLYLKGAAGIGLLSLYYAEVLVLSPSQRGAVVAVGAVLSMVGVVLAAPLGDRLLAERPSAFLPLAAAGTAVQAACLLVLGFTDNRPIAIAVSLPISAFDIVLLPAFFSLLSQVVPARVRGVGLQILQPAQLAGIIAFPILVGVVDRIGLHRGIALFAVPTAVAAVILAGGGAGTARDRRTAVAAGLAEAEATRAAAAGVMPALLCRDLVAGYGSTVVIDGIDLDVAAGEVVAVVGPNGAGKTTLLKALAGIVPVSSGAVLVGGADVLGIPAHVLARRGITLVPGGAAVIPDLTVAEHLSLSVLGTDSPVFRSIRSQNAEGGEQLAGTLSGGEQQLLALECARVAGPSLLLIDELSLGLAPAAVRDALASARAMADGGAAVVVVEQAVEAVLDIADRVVIMEKGQLVFTGTPAELRARPGNLSGVALGRTRSSTRTRTRAATPTATVGADAALSCRGVSVAFGGVHALTGVDLDVAPGEIVGLIGPNGAGKTTLFDVLSGFIGAEGGTVAIAGTDVSTLAPHQRARLGLGRSFQRARLFPAMSVRDAVLAALDRRAGPGAALAPLGLPAARRSEARLRRRADTTLELLDLDHWAGVAVGDLPTGTRRLVSLACTLAFEPSVLLLDEPTAGLARLEAEEVPPLLRRTARETGAALLVIEHDVALLATAADRLVAMVAGRIVASGDPAAVVDDPVVLSSYLGPQPTET